MISLFDYIGTHGDSPDWTVERQANAATLLEDVNRLLEEAESKGVELEVNPHTHTFVSGITFGGFRPQNCAQGAPHSAHKEGLAVDVYDPHGALDRWLTDLILEKYGLYRESPLDTDGWTHLTSRSPGSGKRTFRA